MNMKEWFKTLLAGMAIGVSSAIPGVSGGTIAVILKVYEKIIWAISNIFKEFKKAVIYLLPVLLGVVIAVIPTMILMDKALEGLLFGVVCLFAGFIVGSFPGIVDEVRGQPITRLNIVAIILATLVALGLGIASVLAKADVTSLLLAPEWWLYLVLIPVGVIASIALVVPGISGSMLLLLIGFYKPLINTTIDTAKQCLEGNWSNFGSVILILLCFAIGVIIGFFLISKLMNYLLSKYRQMTFYAIIGFVIGSTIALFMNYEIYEYYKMWASGSYVYMPLYIEIPVGLILLSAGFAISYLLVRYKRKIDSQNNQDNQKNA
jgi:putative membrane protein